VEHYFSCDPEAPHSFRRLDVVLRGERFVFWTDRGMFSPERIDRGTRLLVETFHASKGSRILDLGAGYGVLGIVAARVVPHAEVWLLEVNRRAAELAVRNARENGLDRIHVVIGESIAALPDDLTFHTVLTNPPIRAGQELVFSLYRQAVERLVSEGELWTVVRTRQGAERHRAFLADLAGEVELVARGGGYRVFRARRRIFSREESLASEQHP